MRRRIAFILPLAALAACAPPYGGGGGPHPDRGSWEEAPLNARIYSGGGRIYVSANRPAHVAVFEILPGRGLGLVYPESEYEENRLIHGSEWLPPSYHERSRWFMNAGASPFYAAYAGPARFYLLIASVHPLDVERFRRSPGSLRSALGIRYAAASEMDVMDALVARIVPPQPDEDWSTDVLAVWPSDDGGRRFRRQLVRVVCPDGSVSVVPREFVAFACRRPERRVPPVKRDTTQAPGQIARPGGRRPQPEAPTPPAGEEVTTAERFAAPRDAARIHRGFPAGGAGRESGGGARIAAPERTSSEGGARTEPQPRERTLPRAEQPEAAGERASAPERRAEPAARTEPRERTLPPADERETRAESPRESTRRAARESGGRSATPAREESRRPAESTRTAAPERTRAAPQPARTPSRAPARPAASRGGSTPAS